MSKYISRNCGQEVTAAQYLAELMCTRQAQRANVDLPFKFWNLPDWKKAFMQQLFKANALLKLYPEEVIVGAIESNQWLTTLLWKDIATILDAEQKRLNDIKRRAESAPKFEETNVDEAQKKFVSNEGRLNRLKRLDE